MVRVNGAETPQFERDLELVQRLPLDAIVLPKATPESVAALGRSGPPVIAIVETAQGLRLAYEIASHPRVGALLLGAVDLGLELGLEARPDGQEVLFARSKLVLDSAAAGIRGAFRPRPSRRARRPRARGGVPAGALARVSRQGVHPPCPGRRRQRAPSRRARESSHGPGAIVESYESGAAEGRGAVALDGEMIDLPVVERARRLIADDKRRMLDAG